MIRCFKCDTPATQGPDGVIHMGCNCFPPNLIRREAVSVTYTAVPEPARPTPDGLQYCQNCGTPMLQPDHTCHKVKPVLNTEAVQDALKPKHRDDLTPAMAERLSIMREDARIENEPEYKRRMKQCIEHLKSCSTCKYLSQVDGSVCADMVKLRATRDDKFIAEVKAQ